MQKTISALVVALLSGGMNSLLLKYTGIDQGASFIVSVLIISFIATLWRNRQNDIERNVTLDEY